MIKPPGTHDKNAPSKPWEIEHLSSFSPVFPLVSPKNLECAPHKNFIFEITKDISVYYLIKMRVSKFKIVVSETFEIGKIFATFLQ